MIDSPAPDRRLLLVHAHPDDESIGTGATMAHYAATGARVTLVTCTLGEEGEVIEPSLSQLAVDQADQLGGWRITELARAMAELGVSDHRFLGGAGRFRDSGMLGTASNGKPRAFWRADRDPVVFDEAVAALVEVIREVCPQVLVTYDDFGGYGHPDHIMAHRVAMAAVDAAARSDHRAGGAPWAVAKVYWTAMPRSVLREQVAAVRQAPGLTFDPPGPDAPAVADELVTCLMHAPGQTAAKTRALAAHRTQVTVDGRYYALSNNVGQQILATEYFRLVRGEPGGPRDADGHETDLFGGIGIGAGADV